MVTTIFILATLVSLYFSIKLIRISGGFAPWLVYALLTSSTLLRRLLLLNDQNTFDDPGLPIISAILLALFPYLMWRVLK